MLHSSLCWQCQCPVSHQGDAFDDIKIDTRLIITFEAIINSFTPMGSYMRPFFQRALLYPYKGLRGNKNPPHRLCMVGIVQYWGRHPTQDNPQTSPPWWAVCPPCGGDSMGVLHAWVVQKLLKSNILRVVTFYEFFRFSKDSFLAAVSS